MKDKYALFDADFVSKMYLIQKDTENHLIDLILEIPFYKFFCHEQILTELKRHPQNALSWLENKIQERVIVCYSDRQILDILSQYYGSAGCVAYTRMLKDSCDAFEAGYFAKVYGDLNNLDYSFISIEEFIEELHRLEDKMGIQNSIGEIKTFVLQQVLAFLHGERVYVFCSDDNKARRGAIAFDDTRCISVLSSFVRLKNTISFDKETATPYIESWLKECEEKNVKIFRVKEADVNPRQIPRNLRIPCRQVMDEIFEDKFKELQNGMLCYKK